MVDNKINQLIRSCRASTNAQSVSDIHITMGDHPWLRVDGVLKSYRKCAAFTREDIKHFVDDLVKGEAEAHLRDNGSISVAIHEESYGDVRVHIFRKDTGTDLVIRLLNPEVPAFAKLNLPPRLLEFADFPNGLVLFTGATGSGKSTALAALVNEVNMRHNYSIYTIEDPIEYRHFSKKSKVSQLSVGSDVPTYSEALKSFLRADPDVILVGEMRDKETMKAAMQAAETGHLVFSTMHDNSAADTVQRIINSFPGDEQNQIKTTFMSVIRAIVSLKLVPKAIGTGRLPVVEILIANDAIKNTIQKGEYQNLRGLIDSGRNEGMQTLERHLRELMQKGEITKDIALEYANVPKEIG